MYKVNSMLELDKIYNMDCIEGLKQLNRHFIGFEINPNYCNLANKRLEQEYINLN